MKQFIYCLIFGLGFTFLNAQTPEEMKAWENSMTPGAEHKWMETYAGEWIVETKIWMDPSQPPMVSKGSCTNTMTMGGRYLEYVFKGEFMGMPFDGKGVMGFDNTEKKFKSTWRDSMSTGIMYTVGTFDEKTQTMTSVGTSLDPVSKQEMKTKEITRYISKDKYVMEMFMDWGGQEFKTMELTYTRK